METLFMSATTLRLRSGQALLSHTRSRAVQSAHSGLSLPGRFPRQPSWRRRGNRRSLGFARDDSHWERVTTTGERVTTSGDGFRSWVERGCACNETAYPPTMRYLTFLALTADHSSLNSSNIPFGLFHPAEGESKFRGRAQALMRRQ
jgi:hypothetical protein